MIISLKFLFFFFFSADKARLNLSGRVSVWKWCWEWHRVWIGLFQHTRDNPGERECVCISVYICISHCWDIYMVEHLASWSNGITAPLSGRLCNLQHTGGPCSFALIISWMHPLLLGVCECVLLGRVLSKLGVNNVT